MNTLRKKNSGFTLLEIIIVVIIVGVLASLALPRLFRNVEFSRSTEAMAAIGAIRSSMERCLLKRSSTGDYAACDAFGTELDIANPAGNPGSHFGYAVNDTANGYNIVATRNTLNGGDGLATITVTLDTVAGTITKAGTNAFSDI